MVGIYTLLISIIIGCLVYLYYAEWYWKIGSWIFKKIHRDKWEK